MMYYLGSVLSIEVTVKTSEFGRISKGLFVLTKGKIELKTSVISVIDISATRLVFYFYCLLNNLVSDCFETFAVLITSNILLRLSLGSYSCFQAKPKLSLKLISNDLGLRTAAIYVKTDWKQKEHSPRGCMYPCHAFLNYNIQRHKYLTTRWPMHFAFAQLIKKQSPCDWFLRSFGISELTYRNLKEFSEIFIG